MMIMRRRQVVVVVVVVEKMCFLIVRDGDNRSYVMEENSARGG